MTERSFKKRTVGMIENGSRAPVAVNVMKKLLANSKELRYTEHTVKIFSAVDEENRTQIAALAEELSK